MLPHLHAQASSGQLHSSVSSFSGPGSPAGATNTEGREKDRAVKFSPAKHLTSPMLLHFLDKKEQQQRSPAPSPSPVTTKETGRTGFAFAASDTHAEDPMSDVDRDDHSEGSDLFPLTPQQQKQTQSRQQGGDRSQIEGDGDGDGEEIMPFSPGSDASPPARQKLSINTVPASATAAARGKTGGAAIASVEPATPDSPWDEESELEESSPTPASKLSVPSAALAVSGGARGIRRGGVEDDGSSVDSDIRGRSKGGGGSTGTNTADGAAAAAAVSSSTEASAASTYRAPIVTKSGSLLRGGRSSGPSFGSGPKS